MQKSESNFNESTKIPRSSFKESREKSTIQRCPHDRENPYAQISRDLIRDNSISPNCRMILIFLLSNDEKTWVIRPTQLYNQFKKYLGRDSIYKIIDEAMEAGYIMREEYLDGNFKRFQYFLSEKPKFKKCFLHTDPQYTGVPYTENQGTLERTSKEKQSNKKEQYKNPPPLPPQKTFPPKGSLPKENNKEEEEIKIYAVLEDTILNPTQKKRLSTEYSEEQVNKAMEIAKKQKIKKSLIGMLINIIENPEKWEEEVSSPQTKALHYNNILRKLNPKVAKKNDETIPKGVLFIFSKLGLEQISLTSSYFESELKAAHEFLNNHKRNKS